MFLTFDILNTELDFMSVAREYFTVSRCVRSIEGFNVTQYLNVLTVARFYSKLVSVKSYFLSG